MATIRIETQQDGRTGLVFAEVFVDDAATPTLRSEPTFSSHKALVEQVVTMCRTQFPDHNPRAEDPTIGV